MLVDYLRLTTYEPELYDMWLETLWAIFANRYPHQPVQQPQRLLQYSGKRIEGFNVFYGKGKQVVKAANYEKDHFMVDIAGWFAHEFYIAVRERTTAWCNQYRVPRIDVQKTIDAGTFFQCFRCDPQSLMIDMVNNNEWVGRKPVIAYNSDLSIGLGNRKSLQYRRIYRKTEEPETIRFESEWHNRYALQVFQNGITGPFVKSWLNMPQHVDMTLFLGSSDPVKWIKLPSDRAKKAIWLRDNVWPSIMEEVTTYDRQCNTDFGFAVKKSLDTIIAIIDRLDED